MPLLEVRGLEKWYGRRQVVSGVDYEVAQGEVVGLLGPNGAGKTTSFRMTIGLIDADGFVRITDRKKDIIVTAGGKNVAPQNLENELKTDSLISQVMVHGDKRKFVSALITLNPETAAKWAAENGIPQGKPLHTEPRMLARLQQSVDALNARTPSYSCIKRFVVLPRDFTQETGELTPTLKLKRKVVTRNNQALLDSFYVE